VELATYPLELDLGQRNITYIDLFECNFSVADGRVFHIMRDRKMKPRNQKLGTFALLLFVSSPTFAGTLDDDVLLGTSGDGLVFSDPEEGVLEPGIRAVTFTSTRAPDPNDPNGYIFVDPFTNVITDFSDLGSRGDVTNCLMSNNPVVFCDSEGGSGKRVKTQLTGPVPFEMRLSTTPSVDNPIVDYFTFGKTSNYTGARMTGFSLELLDVDGNSMGTLDPADAVLFNLDATDIGLGARLPDGLFGSGGQEGDIGFFSDEKAGLSLTTSSDTLDFGALSNAVYVSHFGTAMLDNSMTPDGLFWDDNDDPTDESALVAWNNLAGGGWTYGTLDTAANIDARLDELAAALGVDVADLEYTANGIVPDDIVAAAEANGLFEVDEIEDLRNANLNFTMTVGNVDAGEFTLRIVPTFADIVTQTNTELQFKTAGHLDAAAFVPYLDLGNAAAYQAAITDLMALSAEERAVALESVAFGFAPAFSTLGFEFSRNQVGLFQETSLQVNGSTMSTMGTAQNWDMGDNLSGLFAFAGSRASYDATGISTGYDIDAYSLVAGLETSLSANTSVGVLLGGERGSADADNGLGSIDATGVSLAVFARSRPVDGLTLQALVGYQDLSYDTTRNVMGETAIGSTDGSQIFAAMKLDYMKDLGALKIGPTAGLEYYDMSIDGFSETGAGIWNLTVGEQSGDVFLGSVGVRGEYQLPNSNGRSRVTGSLEYTVASGNDLAIQSGFVGLPGATFLMQGVDDSWVDVNFGFESVLSSAASDQAVLQVGYSGAFGGGYQSHGVHAGLSVRF